MQLRHEHAEASHSETLLKYHEVLCVLLRAISAAAAIACTALLCAQPLHAC
jgi:hypothetical protein